MPDRDPRTDQELVDAANRGEPAAFEALYFRYRDWVLSLAWRFTGHRDDALDVLQETFAYLLRKFPGFRLTARMTTFLYPVVKHLSATARDRRSRSLGDESALDALAASETPAAGAQRRQLADALAGFSEPQREVLLMRFADGMTLAEIAEALAIPLGTVKSRLHAAIETLRADERTREYFS